MLPARTQPTPSAAAATLTNAAVLLPQRALKAPEFPPLRGLSHLPLSLAMNVTRLRRMFPLDLLFSLL